MRKEAIDNERVDADDDQWTADANEIEESIRDPLLNSIGVLEGVIAEREVLMEGFEAIENAN